MLYALTLWQPWAAAVACDLKHYETRPWKWPDELVGADVAIHASKRWDIYLRRRLEVWPFEEFHLTPPLELGAVVAVVQPGRSLSSTLAAQFLSPLEQAFGDYGPDRWATPLRALRRLPAPVPCLGRQKLWKLPPDVEHAVRQQLETR